MPSSSLQHKPPYQTISRQLDVPVLAWRQVQMFGESHGRRAIRENAGDVFRTLPSRLGTTTDVSGYV